MSFSDILKNKIKTEKQIPNELKPGWIILNRQNYLDNQNKQIIDIEDFSQKESNTTNNNSLVDNVNGIYEIFDLKFGFSISDFYIDMKDYFENNAYNILDNQSNSGELQDFVFKNVHVTIEEQDVSSLDSDDDSII